MDKNLFISPYRDEPSFKSYYNCLSFIKETDWLTTNNIISVNRKVKKNITLFEYLKVNLKYFENIFFCSNSIILNKSEIIELSKANKFILISFDDEYQFYQNLFFAQHCKLILSTEIISSYRYKYYNLNSYFFPHPVLNFSNKIDHNKIDNNILFIGNTNNSSYRKEYLKKLVEDFDNIKIINTGDNINKRLSDQEMYKMYNQSLAVLNFTKLSNNEINSKNLNNDFFLDSLYGLKGRPYEVAIAGGCCISEWNYQLSNDFENKKEILFFKTYEELKLIILNIISLKIKTQDIRKNAQILVRDNYSERKLSTKLIEILKNNINSKQTLGIKLYPSIYEDFFFFNSLNYKIAIKNNLIKKCLIIIFEIYKNYTYYKFFIILLNFIRFRLTK